MHTDAPELTPIEHRMQSHLFGVNAKQVAPVSDAAMWYALRKLRDASEVERFGLFLVGSRLEPGNQVSDIDLNSGALPRLQPLVRPGLNVRSGIAVSMGYIEPIHPVSSILAFVEKGRASELSRSCLAGFCKLRSCSHQSWPDLSVKDAFQHYRRFGRFSIEYWRQADETGFT